MKRVLTKALSTLLSKLETEKILYTRQSGGIFVAKYYTIPIEQKMKPPNRIEIRKTTISA